MLLKLHQRSKLAFIRIPGIKYGPGAFGSRDPVSQAITRTKSTTPLRVDLDSNASLCRCALRDVHSLTIRRILILTLYIALIYRLRRGRGRCNWVQLAKMLRASEWRETSKYVKITKRCNWVQLIGCNWQKCSEWRETSKYVKIAKRCHWVQLGAIGQVAKNIAKIHENTHLNCDSNLKMHEITHFKQ